MHALNGFPYPIFPASTLPASLGDLRLKQVTVIWSVSLSCLLCVSHLTGMLTHPPCHVSLESRYLDRNQQDVGQTRAPRVIFQDISVLRERHWGAGLSFITNK